jgi:hypothetical protein
MNRMIPENSPQALQMRALAATTRDRGHIEYKNTMRANLSEPTTRVF